MTIENAQRVAIGFLQDNNVSDNLNEAIRLLVSKTTNISVEDVINKISLTTYINIIENEHSVSYSKRDKISEHLKRRYIKSINGESKYINSRNAGLSSVIQGRQPCI